MTSTGTRFLFFRGKNRLFFETSDGTQYVAIPNNDICLVEVNSDHVAQLLLRKCGCCGNEYQCFRVASEQEIEQWRQDT